MKKKNTINREEGSETNPEYNDLNELDDVVRRKNIQNKVLKELIDQLKKYPNSNSDKIK